MVIKPMSSVASVILGLQSEITLLKSVTRSSVASNQFLLEENAKLKERLGLTSKNSCTPSSKALYKLKRNQVKKYAQ